MKTAAFLVDLKIQRTMLYDVQQIETTEFLLTDAERHEAQLHWFALMLAPSQNHLDEARLALKAASLPIKTAVTTAIVLLWGAGLQPVPGQSPFD